MVDSLKLKEFFLDHKIEDVEFVNAITQLVEDAFDEGYEAGYDEGYEVYRGDYDAGYQSGYEDGRETFDNS